MDKDSISPTAKVTIVAVHGVGDAVPGDILSGLSATLPGASSSDAEFERSDLLIKGVSYPRMRTRNLRLGGSDVEEVIEMNWADVLRPAAKIWSVPSHLFFLALSMQHLSTEKVPSQQKAGTERTPWLARLYWWTLEVALFWATLLAVTVMLLASCGTVKDWRLGSIAIGATVLVAALAWWLGKYVKSFRAGFFWVPIFALAGITFVWPLEVISPGNWVTWSARAYAASQVLVSATLLGAVIEALVILRGYSWRRKVTRAALAWLPFLIYSGLAVAIWVGALIVGSKYLDGGAHHEWEKVFLKEVHYDLWRAELGMMFANLFIFIAMPLFGLAAYYSRTVRRWVHLPDKPGEAAHTFYAVIFAAAPLALMVGGLFFWGTLASGQPESNSGKSALQIYECSGLRLLSMFPVLLPALRNLLDVAGDVMFHLQPKSSRLSSQRQTIRRLKLLLKSLRRERPQNNIIVLAHSQGSVIAWTLLRKNSRLADRLVTIGSPLSTLYYALLGGDYGGPLSIGKGRNQWKNLYCEGDYIGGSVQGCARNESLGPGSHTGYWTKTEMVKRIFEDYRA